MTAPDAFQNVAILIPRRIRQRHADAVQGIRQECSALIGALHCAPPFPPDDELTTALAAAGPNACKAWIASVIRSLPTQPDTEATHV